MKMKNLFFLSTLFFFAASCSTLQPAGSGKAASDADKQKQSTIEFINDVSIKPASNQDNTGSAPKKISYYKQPHIISYHTSAIEDFSSLRFKYAILEDAAVEEMQNEKLLG